MSKSQSVRGICFKRPLHAELREDILLPEMDADGVLVRTEYSMISRGTELDLYVGDMHGRGVHTQWYPLLPGYIPVGTVQDAGSKVTHLKPGDRVVGSNLFAGLDERFCIAWAGHTDYTMIGRTTHPALGSKRAVRVPESVSPEQAGLGMLAGVAWHGVREKVRPQPGEIILVIGQGVIGLFAAQLCQMMGAEVVVADHHESRLDIARANGVEETVLNADVPLQDAVLERTGGEAPHAVIEVTGELEPLREAFDVVRPYGHVHAQGMYLDAAPQDMLRKLFDKNLTISATAGEAPDMTAECLTMMAEGRITMKEMVSDVADPRDAADVYDALYRQPDQLLTCAFKW